MFRFIIFLCFTFSLLDCQNGRYVHFNIKNETKLILDSLTFKASGGAKILGNCLHPGKCKTLKLNISNVPKQDGNYSIEFLIGGNKTIENFGYYTNGYPISFVYDLKIQTDTILIKENF